jgi:predicted DNA-binding protein
VVKQKLAKMRIRAADKKRGRQADSVRASISFPSEVYETLEVIAKEKKVSLAWVVREAAEQYIGEKWPLFRATGRERS